MRSYIHAHAHTNAQTHMYSNTRAQVYAPSLSNSVIGAAERMGGGKAKPALELVGSADHLQAALKYAFGTSLVCEVCVL